MAKRINMLSPVVCTHCGAIYDLCAVEPICRHADCTTFKTPCCGRHADDRRWKSLPDIQDVRDAYQVLIFDGVGFQSMDMRGHIINVRVIDPDAPKVSAPATEG
jgi:hypothetical protein